MITLAQQVGSGTFGWVYLGRRRLPDQRGTSVAVKIPRNGSAEELRTEYDIMRECVHPGIAIATDFLQGVGLQQLPSSFRRLHAAMVMEPAVSDLAFFLLGQGPCLDAGLAQEWSRTLASALASLHSKGIIHRDIKPQNLLLCLDASSSRSGGYMKCTLKLTDFGSARHLPLGSRRRIQGKRPVFLGAPGPDSLSREFLMTPTVCTAWYRAPEVLSGSATADVLDKPAEDTEEAIAYGAAMDVWSYGAVVYELLTGGDSLSRASTGAGILRCWIEKLETCPNPCLGAGEGAIAMPRYMTTPAWKSMYEVACATPVDRISLPKGDGWEVVGACLRWFPRERLCMPEVLRQPWLAEETVSDLSAASVSTSSTGAVAVERPAGASTPGGVALPSPPVWTPELRAERYKTTPVLHLAKDYSERCVETTGETCQCNGHCRLWSHRRDGKCDETELVKGTVFCRRCLCKVYGCEYQKNKGDMCCVHRRIYATLPVHVKLSVLAADCATWAMPCDVVDFLQNHGTLKQDLAMRIVLALVKEPTATHLILGGWQGLPAEYDADQLRCMLESVAQVCGSIPDDIVAQYDKELEQLGRQGVARYSGLATCLKYLGVIRKLGEDETAPEGLGVALGRTSVEYAFTLDSQILRTFLFHVRAAAPDLVPPCFDAGKQGDAAAFLAVVRYGQQLRRLLVTLADKCQFVAKGGVGYTADLIVRKLCLPYWDGVRWDDVPISSLRSVSADERENLQLFPSHWSAAQVSSFICQRPDWGYLASVFMCIWKDVSDHIPDAEELVARLSTLPPSAQPSVATPLLEAARRLLREHGIAMHPWILVKDARASTPGARAETPGDASAAQARRKRVRAPSSAKDGRADTKHSVSCSGSNRSSSRSGSGSRSGSSR